jgi:NAD(P)H-hydrate epimerase
LVQPRDAFAHKGSFGHALLVAGNVGKMGAAILAAKACLRSGVGLVTVQALVDTFTIVQIAVPEAMCVARGDKIAIDKYAAIGIGPGLGTGAVSTNLVNEVLINATQPMVIDADALNSIATNKWLAQIPANAIITPHAIEFDRLFGKHNKDAERWLTAIDASTKYPFVIVLKGHHTLIAHEGKAWYNTTGNAGMAKGGSGDVLTGIITALLAQQYNITNAALLGVYLHGLAGDLTLANEAIESMLPSDLIAHIGKAFLHLRS